MNRLSKVIIALGLGMIIAGFGFAIELIRSLDWIGKHADWDAGWHLIYWYEGLVISGMIVFVIGTVSMARNSG